jgi:DNA-binding YbaB/EbfC family protein
VTGEGFDLSGLLEQAQAVQQQVVEGQAGGGAVKVRVNGAMQFQSVSIDPDAVDPDDVPMLEDLVLAALRDAVAKVQAATQEALGGFGLPVAPT